MKNFLHGMGGGVGRGIGRAIGYIVVAFLIYLLINFLHVDVKNDIINKVLFLDVNARTIEADVTNSLSIPTDYSGCTQSNGYFWGDDGDSSVICKTHRVKTTISGVLYSLEMVLKNAWLTNQMAFVNITGMSSDFRNNNLYCTITNINGGSVPCTLSFNSKSSLTISFVPNITGNYTLGIYSSTNDAITGINTYGIRKVVITQNQGDNSDIIDSNNQNTQNIINNNNQNSQNQIDNDNQNTQNIINNQNQNAQSQIENANCPIGPHQFTYTNPLNTAKNQYLGSDGSLTTGTSYAVTPYIQVKPNTQYTVSNVRDLERVRRVCEYDAANTTRLISCHTSRTFTTTSTTQFIRINTYVFAAASLNGPVCNDWEKEQLELNNQTQTETNDLIKDDSVDQSQANGFFNNFSDEDFGLSDIVTLPLTTIRSLTSRTCQPLVIPVPFTNSNITLPCMTQVYQEKIPTVFSIWRVVSFGLVAYWIATDVFKLVKGFKDPEEDKVEVMDL